MIENIPLIIPNFNQLTYLRNLVNWFHFYYPSNPIVILDNGSTYAKLHTWYDRTEGIEVFKFPKNDFLPNLRGYLAKNKHEYYLISDPDIMPHPATPPFFLEVFVECIKKGYHHVGFDLLQDIPDWNKKKEWIIGNEKLAGETPVTVDYNGQTFLGRHAALDTTFALYSSVNGGWHQPMGGKAWGNALRLFKAFHLGWYLHPDYVNGEMKNYFDTCKRFEPGVTKISAGNNNYRPE